MSTTKSFRSGRRYQGGCRLREFFCKAVLRRAVSWPCLANRTCKDLLRKVVSQIRRLNKECKGERTIKKLQEDGAFLFVPGTGFEPAHLAAPPPEDGASTNFATRAKNVYVSCFHKRRRVANIGDNPKPETSNVKLLHRHIKLTQRIVQACFLVRAFFALAND